MGFAEGVEFSIRVPAAAAVLDDAGVAIAGQSTGLFDARIQIVAIRGAHEDGGEGAWGPGQVEIGGEGDIIAHRDFEIEAHFYVVVGVHRTPPGQG